MTQSCPRSGEIDDPGGQKKSITHTWNSGHSRRLPVRVVIRAGHTGASSSRPKLDRDETLSTLIRLTSVASLNISFLLSNCVCLCNWSFSLIFAACMELTNGIGRYCLGLSGIMCQFFVLVAPITRGNAYERTFFGAKNSSLPKAILQVLFIFVAIKMFGNHFSLKFGLQ